MTRRPIGAMVALGVTFAAVAAACVAFTPAAQGDPTYPTAPPAAVCGNATVLDGPTTAPTGAVVVPAGAHTPTELLALEADNTTFYFASGVHYFLGGEFSQISMGQNSTYIGAPGAIVDGSGDPATPLDTADDNRYAFSGQNTGVVIKHLTVRNFKAPRDEGVVNHNSGDGWTLERNTFINNQGAALMAGATNLIKDNCFKDNGQYGLNAFKATNTITDLVVTGNEFVGNNTRDWENVIPGGCGCTGGMKFWAVDGADVTNNWVHDNRGTGIWADTNNNDFLIQGNLIEGNDGTAIFYEISYNAVIRDNNIRNNNWVGGKKFADNADGFPMGAVYLSEADGEPRLPARTNKIEVTSNLFENNWGGVVGWANADRFCSSGASTTSDCTAILGWQNDETCATGDLTTEPLYTDCRWWTSGLDVHHNTFDFNPLEVAPAQYGAAGCPVNYCGFSGLTANFGITPPYTGDVIQQATVYNGGNLWHDNTYVGPWRFKAPVPGDTAISNINTAYEWTHAPLNQDVNSTFDGGAPTPPSTTTTPPPTSTSNPSQGAVIADSDFEVGPYTARHGARIEVARGGAHDGRWSLLVESLDPYGAVEGTPLPGYAVVPGKTYDFSVFYREVVAPMENVEWEITWHDAATNDLRTDDIWLMMGVTSWTEASGSLVAPPNAAYVTWNFVWGDGLADTSFQLDDVHVEAAN